MPGQRGRTWTARRSTPDGAGADRRRRRPVRAGRAASPRRCHSSHDRRYLRMIRGWTRSTPKPLAGRHRDVEGRWPSPCEMAPGRPADQIRALRIDLVDRLLESATPETAREVADRTWDLVHDRPDSDPVKRRVVEIHDRAGEDDASRRLRRPGRSRRSAGRRRRRAMLPASLGGSSRSSRSVQPVCLLCMDHQMREADRKIDATLLNQAIGEPQQAISRRKDAPVLRLSGGWWHASRRSVTPPRPGDEMRFHRGRRRPGWGAPQTPI